MQRMFPALILIAAATVSAQDRTSQAAAPLTPAAAIAAIGQPEVRVRMLVRQTKDRLERRGIIFLDSEDDFNDPANLGIAVSAKVALAFKQQGIDDLAAHLKARTIEVTGCVMRFEDRFYVPVLSPEQLKVIDTN